MIEEANTSLIGKKYWMYYYSDLGLIMINTGSLMPGEGERIGQIILYGEFDETLKSHKPTLICLESLLEEYLDKNKHIEREVWEKFLVENGELLPPFNCWETLPLTNS